ncbi:hypothetical protein HID58_047327 [Brassica napus]|uniref:(rape) hypothetical protein n=1 Tax=Brassica napus TaxID=3708 RepID=A0A816K8K4_BRANA|nr:uncharacterized protein BNAC02G21850D isoform X1 [Brassica napus]KAH0897759.1 hypothetical protein HID58_047327 [Brassica napus]CAF1910005.1 unnamed protein product [Brassica napus]
MGPAWFGKIYNKLETILVEVDTFTSQNTLCLNSSDPSGWESVRGEPDDRLTSPSCERSPSDPPSHQNFDVLGNVSVEEQVEEDIMKEDLSVSSSSSSDEETLSKVSLIQEYCVGNLTSPTSHGNEESPGEASVFPREESVEEVRVESFRDYVSTATLEISNVNPTDTKFPDAPAEDNMRSSNEDDVINGKPDAPLDTKALSGITFQEDHPGCVDDNELYALHFRTKKLRSVKRKILDALTTKRIREKEYEQLAIWFGDADMGSDLVSGDSEAIDFKSSQVHESADSQWELL